MSRNSSVKHKPEVNEGKLPIFFSEDSLHHTGCWLSGEKIKLPFWLKVTVLWDKVTVFIS